MLFMNEKKLSKLESEQIDDDFEKMLQDFINQEFDGDRDLDENTNSDDSDADDDTNDFDDSDDEDLPQEENPKPKPWRNIDGKASFALSVCVHEDFDKSYYCSGPVTVHIETVDEALPATDRFKCYVFTEDYFPMCDILGEYEVKRSGNELDYVIPCSRIWLPGRYILFVRDDDDALVRLEFQYDENRETNFDQAFFTMPCCIDDVLTTNIVRDTYWQQLAIVPGMSQFRRKVMESHHLGVYNEVRKEFDAQPVNESKNLLICTRNKDLTRQHLSDFRMLFDYQHSLEYVDCATLYDPACNNPYEHLGSLLCSLNSEVICLTGLSALLTTGGKIIVKRILDRVRESPYQNPLWLCGARQEIKTIFEQFPSMKELFTSESWIDQEPYTAFELVQAFFMLLDAENLTPSVAFKDAVTRAILQGYDQGTLINWSLSDIRRLIVDDIRPRYTKRILKDFNFDILPLLVPEDVDTSLLVSSTETFEDCMDELNKMVGLDKVKKGIATMANNTRFLLRRRRKGLHTSEEFNYHCIFTGNPGTGKTTVARMLGRMYHSLGLLSKGEVIAVDRTRLVGRFIGETEENMKAVLEEARGNVLFIDEAYNLYDGSGDRKDFGARVIDSLLTVLSQPDPDMLVVFAGYEKEMDAMLATNPGLNGRFPYKYKFSDYNPEQLMEIADRLLKRDEYILTDEASAILKDCITQTYASRNANFSNARWVEQFVRNGIIPAMADRLVATDSDDYQSIEASDIRLAYEKFNPKATELKPRRKVGFSA